MEERAYRKKEWKAREERKRIGVDDDDDNFERRGKKKEEQDYDKSDVPDDYTMPVAVLIPGRLMVGPPCVTKRQKAYVKQQLGNPAMVPLDLPPLADRKLWKLKEAVTWYGNYARSLSVGAGSDGSIYLYHETGCKEEALVGWLVWSLWSDTVVPITHDTFMDWRERTSYLWFLDREEETLLPIALGCLSTRSSQERKKSEGLLTKWLKKK